VELGQRSLHDENVSHILLIPFISAWLLGMDRRKIQARSQPDFVACLTFLLPAALVLGWILHSPSMNPRARLCASILSLFFLIVSGFILIFGREAARAAWFPFAFLLFSVPLPDAVLDRVIYALQAGSAAVAEFFFDLSGFPVLREGFVFRLPRISIEVAQECSGIRSSIALLILAVLVSHFSFRLFWKKAVFVCAGLAMMVVKNGIRIATLTLLANYVDPDFLYGNLHHRGGVVFFLIGLALLVPVYWLLRRGEEIHAPAEDAVHA
jgi:exosortase